MATVHLKSSSGNVSPYVDWSNAATTLAAAVAAMAAGDTLCVSSSHAEATAGISLTIPGSTTVLTKVLGGTQGATSGLTALANGGVIESTNTSYTVSGNFRACRVTWRASSTSTVSPTFASVAGNVQYHDSCRYEVTGTGVASGVKFGVGTAGGSSLVTLKDPVFKFGNASQRISVDHNVIIVGGSIDAAGTAVSGLFKLAGNTRSARLTCDDFDASACTTGADIVTSINQGGVYAQFRRLKLPASWTGNLVTSGQLKQGDRVEMCDFSSGSTLYALWIADFSGSIRDENTVKVTANTRSYKAVAGTECSNITPLRSGEYFVPLASGSAQTVSLDIATDNVTLTDAEAWLEVDYFSASGTKLGTTARDAVADELASATNQTTSSATWTTTGLTTPVKQVLSVSVTPGQAAYAIARAIIAKPSTTVYLDDRVAVA